MRLHCERISCKCRSDGAGRAPADRPSYACPGAAGAPISWPIERPRPKRENMHRIQKLFIPAWLSVSAASSLAQNAGPYPPPRNILQLQSAATVEVRQDMLSISMTTTIQGDEAGSVEYQLKAASMPP
jgi:hypothetical protein